MPHDREGEGEQGDFGPETKWGVEKRLTMLPIATGICAPLVAIPRATERTDHTVAEDSNSFFAWKHLSKQLSSDHIRLEN